MRMTVVCLASPRRLHIPGLHCLKLDPHGVYKLRWFKGLFVQPGLASAMILALLC